MSYDPWRHPAWFQDASWLTPDEVIPNWPDGPEEKPMQEDENVLPVLAERFNDLAGRLAKILENYEERFLSAGVHVSAWVCVEEGAWIGWCKFKNRDTHRGRVFEGDAKIAWMLTYCDMAPTEEDAIIQRLQSTNLEIRSLVAPSLPKLEKALRERLDMLNETLSDALHIHTVEARRVGDGDA